MLRKWSVFHKRCSVIGADNSGLCRYREPPQHSAVSIDTHGQIAHARSLGARHGSEWHGETRDTNYWITREENEHKTSSSSRCRAGEIRLDKYIYIYIYKLKPSCVFIKNCFCYSFPSTVICIYMNYFRFRSEGKWCISYIKKRKKKEWGAEERGGGTKSGRLCKADLGLCFIIL